MEQQQSIETRMYVSAVNISPVNVLWMIRDNSSHGQLYQHCSAMKLEVKSRPPTTPRELSIRQLMSDGYTDIQSYTNMHYMYITWLDVASERYLKM